MPTDKATALKQIDEVLEKAKAALRDPLRPHQETTELNSLMISSLNRLAPPNSGYREMLQHASSAKNNRGCTDRRLIIYELVGVLGALRDDYDKGRLQTYSELVHSDFVLMLSHSQLKVC